MSLVNKFVEEQILPMTREKNCSIHGSTTPNCSARPHEYNSLHEPKIFYVSPNNIETWEHWKQHTIEIDNRSKFSLKTWYYNLPPVVVTLRGRNPDTDGRYETRGIRLTKYRIKFDGNHRVNTCIAEGLPVPSVMGKRYIAGRYRF